MIWLVLIPIFYLFFLTPIAVFRLLHRPRFPQACFAVIGVSLLLPLVELCLMSSDTIFGLVAIWFWLAVSIPTQTILIALTFIPSRNEAKDKAEL